MKREWAVRKKLLPKEKVKPVKSISFKISKALYLQAEELTKENNLNIGQYAKKILHGCVLAALENMKGNKWKYQQAGL